MKGQLFACCGFALLAGLLAANWLCGLGIQLAVLIVIAAVLFVAGLVVFLLHSTFQREITASLFALAVSFSLLPVWEVLAYRPAAALGGQSVFISGEIIDLPQRDGNQYMFTLQTQTVEKDDAPQHLKLRVRLFEPVKAFDRIQGHFYLSLPAVNRGFDARSFYKSKGIYLNAYADGSVERTEATGFSVLHLPLQIRMASSELIDQIYQPDEAALLKGILLGDTSDISDSVKNQFQDAGLAHILAVSGTHTVLIAQLLLSLLKRFGVKVRAASLITIFFILLFMAVTGFTPSVNRAGIMCILALTAQVFFRQVSPLNSLGASLLILLIINPYSATDVGLLLSFSATLGILVFPPLTASLLKHKNPLQKKPYRFFIEAGQQSLSASVSVIPVSLLVFSSISVLAPFSNLAACITFQPILVLGLLSIPLYALPFGQILCYPFAVITAFFTKMLSFIADFFGTLPFSTLPSGYDFIRYGILGTLLFLILLGMTGLYKKRRVLSTMGCLLIFLTSWATYSLLEKDAVRVAVFTEEKGGGVVLTGNGHAVILQGDSDQYLSSDMEGYLIGLGYRQIDLYISSDPENRLINNSILRKIPCGIAAVTAENLSREYGGDYQIFQNAPLRFDFGNGLVLTAYNRNGSYYALLKQGSQTVLITDYPYLSSVQTDFLIVPSGIAFEKMQLPKSPPVLMAPVEIGHNSPAVYPTYAADYTSIRILKIKNGSCHVLE